MRLVLFGSPAVEANGATLALPFERRNQLVAFLALKRAWVARAELAALLWPDQAGTLAYANLRKTLHRLQGSPWAPRIDAEGNALRFVADTDVADFDAALREGRLADALPLRRAELLEGYDDDASDAWSGWLAFERDRLRQAWRGAALDRLAGDIDATEAIALSARLLDADPLDEAALRKHLAWLSAGGQASRARQAYRDYVRRLDEDLGIAPGAELRALHDSLGATRRVEVAPNAAAPGDEGFVGRAAELKRIAALIAQDDCRLVTIVGPGGVGKTRLARRALDAHAGFGDGTAFVPLDDLASAAQLGARLARELDVSLNRSGDPLEQVAAFLRERTMLVVLDNVEQLADGAGALARLLDASPRLKLIVTSRVRLALPGEWLLPLQGLPWPDTGDEDRFEAFDAVRLFVKAARRVEPALVPDAEAAAILDICRQVEGLPLALELAASWTRVLSCNDIARELREGTEILHAVDPSRPARQASMEVVFDNSWRHLGAAERDALARLAVFSGGFTPEAARAVTGAKLPVLGALADKSLLRKDGPRMHLHPLVQQLAARRLGAGELRDAAGRAHADHYLRLLAQHGAAIADGDREALKRVDAELENVRAAWRWAASSGAADLLAQAAIPLRDFVDVRGRLADGLAMLGEAIASPAAAGDRSLAVLLDAVASHLAYCLDRYADAFALAESTLARSDPVRDDLARHQCMKTLGSSSLRLGRLDDARRYYQLALDARPAAVDPNNAAAMLDNLALVERAMGNHDAALEQSRRSLAQHRALGDAAGVALCLNNLASMHLDRREFSPAAAYLREGLSIAERQGLTATRTILLINLAQIAVESEDVASAEVAVARAREANDAGRNRALGCWLMLVETRLDVRRGAFGAARATLKAALDVARSIERPLIQRSCVVCFADLLAAEGEPAVARRVLAFVGGHPSTTGAERAEIRDRLAELPPAGLPDPPWPALALDELMQRIAGEADVAHAHLVALLRPKG